MADDMGITCGLSYLLGGLLSQRLCTSNDQFLSSSLKEALTVIHKIRWCFLLFDSGRQRLKHMGCCRCCMR